MSWSRFFFAEQSSRPLRVFRAVFGAWLVTYYLRLYDLLHAHYGRGGMVVAHELRAHGNFLRPSLLAWLSGNETAFALLFLATLGAAILLSSGRAVRFAAFGCWALNATWVNPLVAGNNSADQIVTIFTFLFLVAAAAGHLDRKRATVPAWTSRLFQVQIAFIYFFSGWQKSGSNDWSHGEAMHYVFQQTTWARISFHFLDHPLVVGAFSYGTLFFELLVFPVLVWPKATRPFVLLAGVFFHVGIALTMKVFIFGEILPLAYLAFLSDGSPVIRHLYAWGENIRATLSHSLAPLRVLK